MFCSALQSKQIENQKERPHASKVAPKTSEMSVSAVNGHSQKLATKNPMKTQSEKLLLAGTVKQEQNPMAPPTTPPTPLQPCLTPFLGRYSDPDDEPNIKTHQT